MLKKIEIIDIVNYFKETYRFLLKNWLAIIIAGLIGGAVGLTLALVIKPKYVAHLSFVLVDKPSSSSGLTSLVSSLGISSMLGVGPGDAFSGDNLIEIIKSKNAIEKTLLTKIDFNGENLTLADAYIDINELHRKWKKAKNRELRNLNYVEIQDRSQFTRTQDSILHTIYKKLLKSEALKVERKDKKTNLVYIDLKSKNEVFSKLFVENLIDQTYNFYKDTKIGQNKVSIEILSHTADSIKTLYETALESSALIAQTNLNKAMQLALVPRLKEEYNVQLYGAVYAEVLKSLETLKLDMARETPIFQIIDEPIYPLKLVKIGKAKGIVIGGFIGGMLIILFFMAKILWSKLQN